MIVNVGHPEGQDELEKVLTATMGESLPHVLRDPMSDTTRCSWRSDRPVSAEHLRRAAPPLPLGLRATARAAAGASGAAAARRRVYTDDKAPVEWLIDRSIVDYAADE